jgi:SAM-dependent methyltransferase
LIREKLKAIPGIDIVRRIIGRESVYVVRARLARKYIQGSGIEFGALNAPLDLPKGATVRYADTQQELRTTYPDVEQIKAPDIVSDIESMVGIEDASVDFVIANHVLEHVENPLRALQSMSRVLRGGGIAFIALPDKRFSFDVRRPITSLDHITADYNNGPDHSLAGHYEDWVHNVEGRSGAEGKERIAALLAARTNIHFHVWDYPAMEEMFDYAARLPEIRLSVRHSQQNRTEAIWILVKANEHRA